MKNFFTISLVFIATFITVSTVKAQVGSGGPPPSVAQPDKFPNITWTQSASCSVSVPCTNNIYRGIVAGGTKGKINTSPVTTQPYRDLTAAFGVTNFYTVTAVRTSDSVESVQSAEASATATQGSPSAPTGVNIVVAILIKVGKGIIFAVTFGRVNLFS